ncbi:MAG: menaquinone biosynthesis protein [Proteobacteria bacterium]|nr:menaquinone biosynthesis protein [Pseudomonadota bacterium]
MKKSNEAFARIGMVKYLNTAPIHEKWKSTVQHDNWQLVEGAPAVLNRQLAEGQIDLGFVSSYEYAAHPKRYKILSGLSISANGPVGSVFLFSHVPMEHLDAVPVLLSSHSETSVSLVKIILEDFYHVHPKYVAGDVLAAEGKEYKALLAIGDDALRLVDKATYLYQFDLGDIWKRETGLPFVFSVCAVREEFCELHSEMLVEIHRELLRCRDEGKNDLKAICQLSASRIPMSEKRCYEYLVAIEHDLNAQKRKALETFFSFLIRRGEVGQDALPLKIISNLYTSI